MSSGTRAGSHTGLSSVQFTSLLTPVWILGPQKASRLVILGLKASLTGRSAELEEPVWPLPKVYTPWGNHHSSSFCLWRRIFLCHVRPQEEGLGGLVSLTQGDLKELVSPQWMFQKIL